ncbi:MAG TPA: type II toxin-antitoxin system HicB family antitoxin, partial [Candidatus Hodarchaeales archaeon]|nr:type II toxin-antitoxin system HicB family antitoxin [Candidatus Hodarchaeales archaeon]
FLHPMAQMKFRLIIEQDEDGLFVAECPSLPECISEGKTREDALRNISDAIGGYLESLKKHKEPIPPSIEEEIVDLWLQIARCTPDHKLPCT